MLRNLVRAIFVLLVLTVYVNQALACSNFFSDKRGGFPPTYVPEYKGGRSAGKSSGNSLLHQFGSKVDPKIQAPELVAIHRGWKDLSNRQSSILEQLPKNGSKITINKNDINVTDLAALTAKTGDEFAMFTLGSRRIVVRGDALGVELVPSMSNKLKSEGWKWSAHTHPGDSAKHLQPSGNTGDRGVLAYLDQEQSLILNSLGRRKVFGKNEKGTLDLDIGKITGVKSYEIN